MDLANPSALPKVTISGTLTMPENAKGKAPAMIISHTAGGVGPHEYEWSRFLNGMGIATFVIDSFSGRAFGMSYSSRVGLPSPANDAVDALNALKLLATHPRIDASRIGIIGFSRGGNVALYSLLEPIRQSVIDDNLRFAAHVSFYPGCNIYAFSKRVDPTPTLLLLGEADNEFPAAACQSLAEKLRANGASIKDIVYPGANHAFDAPQSVSFVQNLSFGKCSIENNLDTWRATNPTTGAAAPTDVREAVQSCTTSGVREGQDPAARRQSYEDVRAFLKQTLHL
jgi:dienelactone hydrolase